MAWNNGQGYGPMKGVPNGKGGEGPYGQVPAGKEDMTAMPEQAPLTMPQPTETVALPGAQEPPNAGEAAAQQGEEKSAYEMIPCVNVDKATLVRKLQELQKSSHDGRSKWWSFCKVHGEGKFDPREQDEVFLQTFFEAYDAGEVPDEPGCPFTPSAAKGSKGCKGGYKGGGAGGASVDWSSPSTNKVFVGSMPKTVTEQNVREHFTQFGTVTGVELKYDAEGNFRSFGFVSFSDPASAQLVMSNVDNNNMEGKWIDCRFAESNKGKGGCGKGDMKGCFGKTACGKGGGAAGWGGGAAWGAGDSWGAAKGAWGDDSASGKGGKGAAAGGWGGSW